VRHCVFLASTGEDGGMFVAWSMVAAAATLVTQGCPRLVISPSSPATAPTPKAPLAPDIAASGTRPSALPVSKMVFCEP
jgi:hypothetical protein